MSDATVRLIWFRRIALAGVLLTLVVVVLGAWVRLSAAGLGCPDWPGCYGHLTAGQAAQNLEAVNEAFPQRPFEYHKAVKEMLHRYFASTLGLLIVVLAAMAISNRQDPLQPVKLPIALVALVIFQGLLGMWTVTLLLKPLIVVLHLLGGLATLSLLAWLAMPAGRGAWGVGQTDPSYLPPRSSNPVLQPAASPASASVGRSLQPKSLRSLRSLAMAALSVLVIQIVLGGWTSANYAAFACPDFPTCQNSFWPEMDTRNAFVLWRGLGIDYEGGVLDHPARVAIHFVHRLGAVATAFILGWLSFAAWRSDIAAIRVAGMMVGAMLILQLILGPVMVIRALPLWLATAHNAVAAVLLLAVIWISRLLTPTRSPLR